MRERETSVIINTVSVTVEGEPGGCGGVGTGYRQWSCQTSHTPSRVNTEDQHRDKTYLSCDTSHFLTNYITQFAF